MLEKERDSELLFFSHLRARRLLKFSPFLSWCLIILML